jgi:hypothetical protein
MTIQKDFICPTQHMAYFVAGELLTAKISFGEAQK